MSDQKQQPRNRISKEYDEAELAFFKRHQPPLTRYEPRGIRHSDPPTASDWVAVLAIIGLFGFAFGTMIDWLLGLSD